jgi:hypothetical protein
LGPNRQNHAHGLREKHYEHVWYFVPRLWRGLRSFRNFAVVFRHGICGISTGTSLTSTPNANVYDGSTAGNAVINGSPGTVGFTGSGGNFTGSASGGVLNITAANSGLPAAVGDTFYTSDGVFIGTIASPGTGTGGAGTYNLAPGYSNASSGTLYSVRNRLDFPGNSTAIYSSGGGMTLWSVAKVAGGGKGEGLISDYVNNSAQCAALLTSNGGNQLLAVAGSNTVTNSSVNLPANSGTQWALYVAVFTATQVQAFYWRTSTGLVSGAAVSLPSGTLGSNSKALQIGRPFTSVPSATTAAAGIYKTALSAAQIAQLGVALAGILADYGEAL